MMNDALQVLIIRAAASLVTGEPDPVSRLDSAGSAHPC